MTILFLTPAEIGDRSFGGGLRAEALRTALAQVGEVHTLVIHGAYESHLDATWSEAKIKRATFNRFGASLDTLRQRIDLKAWVAAVVRERPWDIIVASFVGLAVLVPLRDWDRLVLDADDLVKKPAGGVPASPLTRVRVGLRNAIARFVLVRVRHAWIVNPADFERLKPSRASLLSNVITLPAPDRPRRAAVAGRILMVGFFEHPPNAEGLGWFVEHVLPALVARFADVELHAIGKHAEGFERRFAGQVRMRGFVTDLAPEYDEASLVVAPILSGSGTQIKVLDALAHGRPLVASKFAHAGFGHDLHDEEHLLVAGDEIQWIDCCSRILADPESAAAMARRGSAAVHAAYGTTRMEAAVRQTLMTLGSGRAAV